MRSVPRRQLALAAAAAALSFTSPPPLAARQPPPQAELYPLSWTGRWTVERRLDSIEGDANAAEAAWRAIGGCGEFVQGHTESYETAFLLQEREQASIIDLQAELSTRNALAEAAEVQRSQIKLKRKGDRGYTLRLIGDPISLKTLSTYGAIERWVVTREGGSKQQQQQQLVVEVSRSYKPVNAQGLILGREVLSSYPYVDAAEARFDQPSSTSRSSLTLRPISRPLSDPVRRRMPE